MPDGNPYRELVSAYAALVSGDPAPAAGAPVARARYEPDPGAPAALVFSPHPDDECIVGALPRRLQRERGVHVVNVAVTLGSRVDRREARWREVGDACASLGFEVVAPVPLGLERIVAETRAGDAAHWTGAVSAIAGILRERRPPVVFLPHAADWNRTHVGTHLLVLDALARMPAGFRCQVVETEFWGAMASPNLMVESSEDDVAALVHALSLHVGEVARNPYHLRLPAWMIDNVRRGAELVGGQGGAAPDFAFATLYRLRRWSGGRLEAVLDGGRQVGRDADLADLFTF